MVKGPGKDFIRKSFLTPIPVNMWMIKRVAMEYFSGLTVIFTRVIFSMTNDMDMANSIGMIALITRECGVRDNNREKENWYTWIKHQRNAKGELKYGVFQNNKLVDPDGIENTE